MSGVRRSMMVLMPSRLSFPPLKTWDARKSLPSLSMCPASCRSLRLGIPYFLLKVLVSNGGLSHTSGPCAHSPSSMSHVQRFLSTSVLGGPYVVLGRVSLLLQPIPKGKGWVYQGPSDEARCSPPGLTERNHSRVSEFRRKHTDVLGTKGIGLPIPLTHVEDKARGHPSKLSKIACSSEGNLS